MINSYSISQLFTAAFGYRGIPFPGPVAPANYADEEALSGSVVNAGVYQKDGLVHTNWNGATLFMPVEINGLQLPNEPTIRLSRKKRIVKTVLTGNTRAGTVKELIATGDWELTIRGVAISYTDGNAASEDYPYDVIAELNNLFNLNEAVEIKSALTDELNITNIVIESFELPEMVGIQHAQAYQLTACSDEDFILIKD